jgi:hypothetical protein
LSLSLGQVITPSLVYKGFPRHKQSVRTESQVKANFGSHFRVKHGHEVKDEVCNTWLMISEVEHGHKVKEMTPAN